MLLSLKAKMMWESPSSLKSPLLGPTMGRHPALLYLSIALSAVGGFLFGYDTGVIAGAMPLIERDVDFWGEKDSGCFLPGYEINIIAIIQMRQLCGSRWKRA